MTWIMFVPLWFVTLAWLVALRAMHRRHTEAVYWRRAARQWEQMARKVTPFERSPR